VTVTERSLRVLIVDDEKNIRATLAVCVEALGADVHAVATGEAALSAVARRSYDLAFVDLKLGAENGLDVLSKLMAKQNTLTTILSTAYGTSETALDATRRGAWEYLPKPFTPRQIRSLLERFRRESRIGVAALPG
jgi:NtrC-family two-component system response regulator AlgB